MRAGYYHRHVSSVRRTHEGTTCLGACIDVTHQSGASRVRFAPASPADETLRERAEWWHQQFSASLPPMCRSALIVEVGLVEDRIEPEGRPLQVSTRPYAITVCRGLVWELPVAGALIEPLFHGEVAPSEIPGEASVVLGPSAVATLFAGLMADAATGEFGSDWVPPWLLVLDTTDSPYPPQRVPTLEEDGCNAQILIEGSQWRMPSPRAQAEAAALGALTEPRRWADAGALSLAHCHNLEIRGGEVLPKSGPCLVIDTWQNANDRWLGVTDIHAEFSLIGVQGENRCGAGPLRLRIDIPWLLRNLEAVAAPLAPAVEHHPILGHRFGRAPALRLRLRACELLAMD